MGHWVHFEGPNETPKVQEGGSACEFKGQLGAGQLGSGDQNTNEEKQLLQCEPPFGVTSVTAQKWKQSPLVPGAETFAQPGQPQLTPLLPPWIC